MSQEIDNPTRDVTPVADTPDNRWHSTADPTADVSSVAIQDWIDFGIVPPAQG